MTVLEQIDERIEQLQTLRKLTELGEPDGVDIDDVTLIWEGNRLKTKVWRILAELEGDRWQMWRNSHPPMFIDFDGKTLPQPLADAIKELRG